MYNKLLEDDDFDSMPDDSKLLFFCLLLFASRKQNKIKRNFQFLQKRLPISKKITAKILQPLINASFINCYQDDSEEIAECLQDATPERETEQRQNRAEEEKDKYMDFVFLSKDEHQKLTDKFGEQPLLEKIASLNDYIGSSGKRYKSHYFTILAWSRKDGAGRTKVKLFPIAGRTCSIQDCKLPAVYKDTSGNYDNYKCTEHLPEKVKELYA